MSGALIGSGSDVRQVLSRQNNSAGYGFQPIEEFEFTYSPSRFLCHGPSRSTSNSIYNDTSISHIDEQSALHEPRSPFSDMVAHFKRGENFMRQNIIQIADIADVRTRKPSWTKLVEILGADAYDDVGVNFHEDSDILLVDDQVIMGNELQLTACLQYLRNLNKFNFEVLVRKRETTANRATRPSILDTRKDGEQKVWKRQKWQKALSSLAK
jgi:hypothetical protein